jgi:hypothetical protein
MDGYQPDRIARALSKGNPNHHRRYLREIYALAGRDDAYAAVQMMIVRGQVASELPAITEALIKRAKRGRTDAAKLLLEMTGIYNPKSTVDHNHSGAIDINLKMGGRPEPIVEAEVVED